MIFQFDEKQVATRCLLSYNQALIVE